MKSPDVNELWRHRNGVLYKVVALANTEGDDAERELKYPPTVVYETVRNGKVWARRLDDWHRSMTFERAVCPFTGLTYVPDCDGASACGGMHIPPNEWPEPEDEA